MVSSQNGFSRNLLLYRSSWIEARQAFRGKGVGLEPSLTTMIGGPYGQWDDFGSFGIVIMIATELGIAAQIPYIRHLLEAHQTEKFGHKDYFVLENAQRM